MGINSRLDELMAAILRIKLRHLDKWNNRRKKIVEWYFHNLPNKFPDLKLPFVPEWSDSCWHQFVVRSSNRDTLQKKLKENGVDTLIHYPIPPHLQQAYLHLNLKPGSLPIAEKLASEVLSLPIGIHLTIEMLEKSVFGKGI